MGEEFRHQRLSFINRLAGQKEVRRAAQSVHVGTSISVFAAERVFHSHEVHSAYHRPSARQFRLSRTVTLIDPGESRPVKVLCHRLARRKPRSGAEEIGNLCHTTEVRSA